MKFLDKQLSLKLKEKGFDKPCFGYYYIETPTGNKEGELHYNICQFRGAIYEDCLYSSNYDYYFDTYLVNKVDAPTIDQVLEWLREEKSLHIVADFEENMKWFFQIAKYYTTNYEYCKYGFNTYEDACIAGIEYVVEHLI